MIDFIGKALAATVRVVNIPARLVDRALEASDSIEPGGHVVSAPLEVVAQEIEEATNSNA